VHWLAHVLGVDTQTSYWYAFYSGVGAKLLPNLGEVALAWVWWHKHNCHAHGCARIGKHLHDGTPYCSRHKPRS
jgi:hypothetical protein